MAAQYITAIYITADKKTKVYIRVRDFAHLDGTKTYFGTTLGVLPMVMEKQKNGDLVYRAEITLTAEKAEQAIRDLGPLDFHETKKVG